VKGPTVISTSLLTRVLFNDQEKPETEGAEGTVTPVLTIFGS